MDKRGRADARFAANLPGARERARMSQEDLAAAMVERGHEAFRQQTITRIENGRRKVSYEEAIDLARCVGTTADALSRPSVPMLYSVQMERAAGVIFLAHERITEETAKLRAAREDLLAVVRRIEDGGYADELVRELRTARQALAVTVPGEDGA